MATLGKADYQIYRTQFQLLMKITNSKLPLALNLSAAILTVLISTGCSTLNLGSNYHPDTQQLGRIRWEQPSKDRLIADVYFSKDSAGNSALLIGKEAPVLDLIVDGENVSARGKMVGPGWSGPRASAPDYVTIWVQLLDAWSTASTLQDGSQEIHTSSYRARYEKQNGRLKAMFVRPTVREDTLTVQFAR